MSKFFKVFGITAAIGTLAYAVFKYKHDEKFKEKADEKLDEAKAKAKEVKSKAIDKACIFAVDHPKVALGILGGTVIGGSALAGIALNNGIKYVKNIKNLGDSMKPLTGEELEKHNKWWEENGYKENFNSMKEFVTNMNLHDDEAYFIAQYVDDDGSSAGYVMQTYVYNDKGYYYKENI